MKVQRSTMLAAIVVVIAAAVYVDLARRIGDTIDSRRDIAAHLREEERRQSEVVDRKLCEVAINGSRADFRALIDDLRAIAAPPTSEAQAERRAETERIIAERYQPEDCSAFVIAQQGGQNAEPVEP